MKLTPGGNTKINIKDFIDTYQKNLCLVGFVGCYGAERSFFEQDFDEFNLLCEHSGQAAEHSSESEGAQNVVTSVDKSSIRLTD